ncbi:hypothetical protein ABT297_34065 [Dactylosporangium sp. NPDC000555]|uniref:hypothetical protein n=1 Tax=Dactylosporangium sp. NPDC000555 TaxID=3154260 RepID=UPI00332A712F
MTRRRARLALTDLVVLSALGGLVAWAVGGVLGLRFSPVRDTCHAAPLASLAGWRWSSWFRAAAPRSSVAATRR